MNNVLDLINTLNVVAIQQQIDDRRKKLEERDIELFVLRRILEAARAAQFGIQDQDASQHPTGVFDQLCAMYERDRAKMQKMAGEFSLERFKSVRINPELCKTPSETVVGSPVAAQERIHTFGRAPSDTSEEDAAAEVEAVFAERASEEVKPVVEEVAAPPAEVVTPPTPAPTPEPPITKPRSLSPDARNQQLSICDRAKIYLEFAYNATAMAIGKGIDLPDPTCMVKHLQKDSRFVKDPRGFWKLAGT